MPRKLVIIPTYNELENIQRIIEKVFSLELANEVFVRGFSSKINSHLINPRMVA